MILVIDNYDSFTYNIVQYLGEIGADVVIFRNDKIDIAQIEEMKPDHILLSPGPCTPDRAGISAQVVEAFKGRIPILGVCLGHQVIGQAFGAEVVIAEHPMHGQVSAITHDGRTIFADIPSPFNVTRYHSLIVKRETLPDCLEISAETTEGEIMAIRHKDYVIEGVQYHPESIMTEYGKQQFKNFLQLDAAVVSAR